MTVDVDPEATEPRPSDPAATDPVAAEPGTEPGVAAGEAGSGDAPPAGPWHERYGWVVPALVVGLIVALPARGVFRAPGPPMEEGFMLVFPQRLLEGDIPNKDFLHLYGPGSIWAIAGWFKAFGISLWTERVFGFLQLVALVAGVSHIGYRWGKWTACVAGATTAIIIVPPIGVTALAWTGGMALALWTVIWALRPLDARPAPAGGPAEATTEADAEAGSVVDGAGGAAAKDAPAGGTTATAAPRRDLTLLVAGLLAGVALLFRPDLVIALGLPLGVLFLFAFDWPQRKLLLIGGAVGVSPYLLHLVFAGPGNAFRGMVLEPVFDLRPGRRLPFPPPTDHFDSFLNRAYALREFPWPLPEASMTMQVALFFWSLFAVCLVLLGVAIWAKRAGSPHGWRLLALALLACGLLPQAVQRSDTAHLSWVSCIPFGLLPCFVAEALRMRSARGAGAEDGAAAGRRRAWGVRLAQLAPLAILLVVPAYTLRWYADYVGQSFDHDRVVANISHRGRDFYYGRPAVAKAAEQLLADVETVSGPGDTLVVGTGDLRKTPYSEAFFYFLLPQLTPGTHYIEMDPGVANADDSGLADEMREADVLILSTVYDDWDEPNTSRDFGSDEPNKVVEEDFCLVDAYGSNNGFDGSVRPIYELYVRCDTGAGDS